jgi:uncharacterized membrane protein YuzA (DUF378 family)
MDGTFRSKTKNPFGVHQVIVLTIFFEGHVSVYKKIYFFLIGLAYIYCLLRVCVTHRSVFRQDGSAVQTYTTTH